MARKIAASLALAYLMALNLSLHARLMWLTFKGGIASIWKASA